MGQLPEDLSSARVVIDCSDMSAAAPSFVDEIVKEILEDRRAAQLEILDAPDRLQSHFSRSAHLRAVSDRLVFRTRYQA